MNALRCFRLAPFLLAAAAVAGEPPVNPEPVLPVASVRGYFSTREALEPKLKQDDLFGQLQRKHGEKDSYTLAELKSVVDQPPVAPAPVVDPERKLAAERVKTYLEMKEALDPKLRGADLFWQLQDANGVKADYTLRQVFTLTDPAAFDAKVTVPAQEWEKRDSTLKPGAFSRQTVLDFLEVLEAGNAAADKVGRAAALDKKFGPQPWFKAGEIREIEKSPNDPLKVNVPTAVAQQPPTGLRPIQRGFHFIRIRADWTDILQADDQSQMDSKMPKSLDDLVGAKLAYTHEARPPNSTTPVPSHTDATSAVGSVIIPFIWRNALEYNSPVPATVAVAPSATINKVATSGDAKGEVDYIYGRLGLYGNWMIQRGKVKGAIVARAAYVHATDTKGQGHLNAGEFDIEPQLFFPSKNGGGGLSLGYNNILVSKIPVNEDMSDQSLFDVTVRAWLHGEVGQIQRNGVKWESVEGHFFRVGPTVQAVVNFPAAWRGISLTAKYSHFKPVQGPQHHNNQLKLDLTFTLSESKALGQKFSFTAGYLKGSLILTKQYVETTTLGLGVVY